MEIALAKIEEETNYWFVRTQQGDYYEEFFLENYIGINWDEIDNIETFKTTKQPQMIKFIREKYPEEKHPGHVFNQLNRFINEIQPGDIVLIPSKRSTHISFGIVTSDVYTTKIDEDFIAEGACPFVKRRNVNWFKTVARGKLDPYLYMLFYSQHTITKANEYAPFIDRALHSLFVKGEKAHLVLQVTTEKNIYARDLLRVLDGALDLVDIFNDETESRLDTNQFEVKINVQSPGPVEIIAGTGGIFVLCLILHYVVGGKIDSKFSWKEFTFKGDTDGLVEKILRFKERAADNKKTQQKIEEVKEAMQKLQVEVPQELAVGSPEIANKEIAATTTELTAEKDIK